MRGDLGKEFYAELKDNEALRAEYEAVGKKYKDQRAVRMKWAERKRDACRTERFRTESESLSAGAKAKYEPIRKTWEAEGLDAAGLQAAKNYWASGIDLWNQGVTLHGHKHVRYNPRTKKLEIPALMGSSSTSSSVSGAKGKAAT